MKPILASLRFLVIYSWEVTKGGFRILWDIFTPDLHASPRIIEVDLPPISSFRRLLIANLVAMTPGSLSVDYVGSTPRLRIHLLYGDTDEESVRRAIRDRFLPAVLSLPHAPWS